MPTSFKFFLPFKISNYNNVYKSFLPFPKRATASTHNLSNIRCLSENDVLLLLLLLSSSSSSSLLLLLLSNACCTQSQNNPADGDRRSSSLSLTSKLELVRVTEFLASEGKPFPDINTGANVKVAPFGDQWIATVQIGVCGVSCLHCQTKRRAPLKQCCLNIVAVPCLNCWAMG
jgi:hypothetical protein